MFKLDETFLQELGLENLPAEQRAAFLEQVYASLTERVGERLSSGMSDEQLVGFEAIIDRQEPELTTWLQTNVPEYAQDPQFMRLVEASNLPPDDSNLKAEFAATKWLELNRPDYRDVVTQTMAELRQEIMNSRDQILAQS